MPVPIAALPCPKCGRLPRMRESFIYPSDGYRYARFILKLECRRWFGIRRCFGPHQENWIEKTWHDVGVRIAIERWNSAVTDELTPNTGD